MRILKTASLAASAAALILTPVAASAAPAAQSLSLSKAMPARAGAVSEDESLGSGKSVAIIFGILVIVGFIFLSGGDDAASA